MYVCEIIGVIMVICFDKIGMLIENKMQVSDFQFFSFENSIFNVENIIVEVICVNIIVNLEYRKEGVFIFLGDYIEVFLLLWLELNNIDYIDK